MQSLVRNSIHILSQLHGRSALPCVAHSAVEGVLTARLYSNATATCNDFGERPIDMQPSLWTWWSGSMVHRTFASAAANDSAQEAELNPLLQTPRPSLGAGAGHEETRSSRGKLNPRERDPKTALAVHRGIPISPKKIAMWTDLMRRQHLDDAIIQCQMSPKKAARICLKVLQSAQANAVHNHGLDGTKLCVDLIHVGQGSHLKKTWPHGRGRSGVRRMYRSHLTVVLRESEAKRFSQFQLPLMERQRRFVRG